MNNRVKCQRYEAEETIPLFGICKGDLITVCRQTTGVEHGTIVVVNVDDALNFAVMLTSPTAENCPFEGERVLMTDGRQEWIYELIGKVVDIKTPRTRGCAYQLVEPRATRPLHRR